MSHRFRPTTCKKCGKMAAFYVGRNAKNDIEYDLYRCNSCNARFGSNFKKIDSSRKESNPPWKVQEKESEGVKCEVCPSVIDFSTRRSNSKTCSKKCGKILARRRKDEYHAMTRSKMNVVAPDLINDLGKKAL